MDITTGLKERILKCKTEDYSILNLKNNIEKKLKEYHGEEKTLKTSNIIINEIGEIVDKTIVHNINVGNINPIFEKEFREFLSEFVYLDIL